MRRLLPDLVPLAAALRCANPRCVCRKERGPLLLHCPAHDDRHPSLSVTVEHDQLLVHRHAGCPQDAVLNVLRDRGLWRKRGEGEVSIPPLTHATAQRGLTLAQYAQPSGCPWISCAS